MSAVLFSASETSRSHGGVQSTSVGGNKPLYRFLRGQPKIIGTVVLILGSSFFIITAATVKELHAMQIWPSVPPTFVQGAVFIASGILYVVTEHNPTKKTVTTSLALGIISILVVVFTSLRILPQIGRYYMFRYAVRHEFDYRDNMTSEFHDPPSLYQTVEMVTAFEAVLLFHSFVGAIIFIVMSAMAGAALRSTKSQTIVVMTALPAETPTEEQP
ncbi:uncharacterized protein LOC115390050 [Salarias fasciatus]|uniref:Uncharacterized LOC115390050 n=1 Tax=Salarias fasciatus TaxID=181472 RepID=A0A672FGX3_SALFA|nr:uncharacterized protein LOC115390050 [Salarias fasciatus]